MANTLKSFTLLAAAGLVYGCSGSNDTPQTSQTPITTTPSSQSTNAPVTQVATKSVDPLVRGAKLFKRCKSCHSLEEGGRHKVGPNLWAVYGSVGGKKEDFKYSKAMAEMTTVWDDESLSAYIENPRKYLPGGKMAFAGLRKTEDRTALLAYLRAETTPK